MKNRKITSVTIDTDLWQLSMKAIKEEKFPTATSFGTIVELALAKLLKTIGWETP